MEQYETSTKSRPLLFFESFVNNDSLKRYENMFYNCPTNSSQASYRDLGYITFIEDYCLIGEPNKLVTVHFKSNLERLLKSQLNLTNKLLVERRDELEYQNIKSDIFLNKQLIRIYNLKVGSESIDVCKELVLEFLNTLESNIRVIGGDIIKSTPILEKVLTNNPYFEPIVRRDTLIKLYDIASDHKILDQEEISQETFLNVLMSNNPEELEWKIRFKCNNQIATFFLNNIEPLFENLSHSKIAKSKSFYNFLGKLLNQNDLDKAKNLYMKKLESKDFLDLQKAINKITPKKS